MSACCCPKSSLLCILPAFAHVLLTCCQLAAHAQNKACSADSISACYNCLEAATHQAMDWDVVGHQRGMTQQPHILPHTFRWISKRAHHHVQQLLTNEAWQQEC